MFGAKPSIYPPPPELTLFSGVEFLVTIYFGGANFDNYKLNLSSVVRVCFFDIIIFPSTQQLILITSPKR